MKRIKRKWVFLLAVVSLLCVGVLGVQFTYGAYIRRSYVKAVPATNQTDKLFGSNLLYGVKNLPGNPDDDAWLSVYPFTVHDSSTEKITVPIKIYNYLAEDQDRVNQLDVSYIISFRITGKPAESNGTLNGYSINGYSVNYKDTVYYLGSNGLTTNKDAAAKQTLPGRLPNTNEYKVTLPGSDLGKVSIAVKAARVSNGESGNYGTDLLYLAARVVPSLASTVQTATVSGKFSYENNETPEDYAAYNYNIELSGASTAVVLKWNKDLLEIDPFFQEKYGVNPGDGQVIFNMEPGIIKVQFYRKENVVGSTWDSLGVTVSES